MSTPGTDPATALELERLRGDIGIGLADIKGSLALLVQRSDQTDRVLLRHEEDMAAVERRVDVLEQGSAARTAADERSRWLISGGGAVLGTIGGWIVGILLR